MIICGLDEVGRGPLAGPIVACAVIFKSKFKTHISKVKLKDSKLLTENQRNEIYNIVTESCVWRVEMISVEEINEYGIGWANRKVFERLVRKMNADNFVVDGNLKINGATSMIDADASVPEVMAASIVAKVTRDRYMIKLHEGHTQYGWDRNKGYGTKDHIEALRKHGPTVHHREMFVRKVLRPRP